MRLLLNISKLNIRSVLLNFYLLPFNQAIYLPICFSSKCKIIGLSRGKLNIDCDIVKPGMIKIGYKGCGIFDYKYERSMIEFGKEGRIVFKGKATLGSGIRLSILKVLELGSNINITGNTSIICWSGIKIGDNALISWDCLILDTDFHKIYSNEKLINENIPIEIGDKVWIGAKSTILKGTTITNNCVIGANSLCSGKYMESNAIYGGNPAKVIKKDVLWQID